MKCSTNIKSEGRHFLRQPKRFGSGYFHGGKYCSYVPYGQARFSLLACSRVVPSSVNDMLHNGGRWQPRQSEPSGLK